METRTRRLDLTGRRFGDWFVEGKSHKGKHGEIYWICRDTRSGETRPVRARNLTSGRSKSSGQRQRSAVTTHGMTRTPTFRSWESMKQRCCNPNAPDYPKYGGRGIRVCSQWLESFENFFADMGIRPTGRTLDRIDVDGDYEPGNCRWATLRRQQRNRRKTVRITLNGRTMSINDWADETGLTSKVILWRIAKGWTAERTLKTPIGRHGRKRQDL